MSESMQHPPTGPHGTDDPKVGTTLLVGLVSVVLLGVLIVALEALHLRVSAAEHRRKVISQQPQELRQMQAEHMEQLNGYRWVDQNEQVVSIPIDRAMRLVVEEARDSSDDAAADR